MVKVIKTRKSLVEASKSLLLLSSLRVTEGEVLVALGKIDIL